VFVSTSYTELYRRQLHPNQADPPRDWLGLDHRVPDDCLGLATALRTAVSRRKFTYEEDLQREVEVPLDEFVRAASDRKIRLHDTHTLAYLRGLKPDITGTATVVTDPDEIGALQVALIVEVKIGRLDTAAVLGQIGKYAIEVAGSRAVDGPVTVAVMNATGILFFRVSDHRASVVWVTETYPWSADGLDGGVYRLWQYVRLCTTELSSLMDAEWSTDYTPVRRLGTGISARVLAARPVGTKDLVAIKVFDRPADASAPAVLDLVASPVLAEAEAEWATRALKAVSSEKSRVGGDNVDFKYGVVPTVLGYGRDYVIFKDVGFRIEAELFCWHHSVQVRAVSACVVELRHVVNQ
jgi:hypothetical protein